MHAVFTEVLLTDKAKSLISHYELHWDAQKIHRDLFAYAATSANVSVESIQCLAYIATIILGDASWRGSAELYILHWQDKIRKYVFLSKLTIKFLIISSILC